MMVLDSSVVVQQDIIPRIDIEALAEVLRVKNLEGWRALSITACDQRFLAVLLERRWVWSPDGATARLHSGDIGERTT